MVWSPIEVALILLVWFPFALPIVLSPYILTIFSINCVAGGSYAVTSQSSERGSWLWFALLTATFSFVIVGGVLLLLTVT